MPLVPEHLAPDPLAALTAWIDEARASQQPQAMAMALATAGLDGRPSVRMVFIRSWGATGLEWITDDGSRKACDIRERSDAAGVIFWPGLGRQVRVEGPVHLVPRDELDALFARRRPEARAAAWAWRQGTPLDARADLIRKMATVRGDDLPITAPPHWVGHRLQPLTLEFWQEDPDGLHDRLMATRARGRWNIQRLAP